VPAPGYPGAMSPFQRDLLIWGGGALLVVLAVIVLLWVGAWNENLLPKQYSFGIL
jgi:hypothetical protein